MQIEQVLQIEAKLLQIGAAPVVTNWGRSSYYKSGQNYYKLGQLLQIGAIISNRCRTQNTILIRNCICYLVWQMLIWQMTFLMNATLNTINK